MGKVFFTIFLYILFLLLLPLLVSSAEYYVDIESLGGLCSDSNPGTTDQPWCTIGKANSDLQPGDTVNIREGSYAQPIYPQNSGTQGNYITYKNYKKEEAVIGPIPGGYGIYLRDKNYIKVDGIRTGEMKFWADLRASPGNMSSHNIIQNCYFDGSKTSGSGWSGVTLGSVDGNNRGTSEHNRIINNVFTAPCMPSDIIYFIHGDCRYNLIEGNILDGGPHVGIEMQTLGNGEIMYNVIRKNRIRNELHTTINIYSNSDWNLLEDNVIYDAGDNYQNNFCGSEEDRTRPRWNHGVGIGSYNVIFRRNRLYNNGAFHLISGMTYSEATGNRIYHNTFYRNIYDVYAESSGLDNTDNVFKNNVFHDSVEWSVYHNVDVYYPNDNYFFSNQLIYQGKGIKWEGISGAYDVGVSFMEENAPSLWKDNTISEPLFANPDEHDFRLQPGSQMIDSGAFLTNITSGNGSGDTFVVEDSTYFTDGWGVIEGDLIQLEGQPQTARITNIDYSNHTITLDASLSWTTGQGVSLVYEGGSPDIGAYEYDPDFPPCTETCKDYACSLYDDCSSAPGTCLEGHCCSGACSSLNDNTPPTVPFNLEAESVSTERINLEWDASEDPETGVDYYMIYRDGALVNQSERTSFSDTGLNPDTIYTYEVSSVNHAGTESQKSASVQKSTLPPPAPQTGLCKGLVLLQHYDQQDKYGEDFSHVYDFSGNGNDGNCIGMECPSWAENGKFGGAFEYDGDDDYFDCGKDESLAFSDEITISAWIYPFTLGRNIVTRQNIFNWYFYHASNGRLGFYIRHPDGSMSSRNSERTINASEWSHVSLVYNDSERTAYFYINGEPAGNGTYGSGMGNASWSPVQVGESYYGSGASSDGMIDDVALWNRTLSSKEIAGLYNESGPVTCRDQCLNGDLNCDSFVDINDLAIIALHFGKTSGFDPRSDTDGSNEIDVYDLVFVASRFS